MIIAMLPNDLELYMVFYCEVEHSIYVHIGDSNKLLWYLLDHFAVFTVMKTFYYKRNKSGDKKLSPE